MSGSASKASLRILHVLSHDAYKSGGAMQAVLLARAQRAAGHRVTLAVNAFAPGSRVPRAFVPLADEGFEVVAVPMTGLPAPWGRRRLRRLLRGSTPDVVHVHRERALRFVVGALAGGTGVGAPDALAPIVAQKGNCYRLDDDSRRAFTHPAVRAVLCVADAVRVKLIEKDGVPAARCHTVYGSFDPERFTVRADRGVVKDELGLARDAPVAGVLANLDRKKGHDGFFEAAARVRAARPAARFVVVGGGDLEAARARARSAGIADAVVFTGFRRDSERMLAAFDVTVCCSHGGEGLTGALRESLALGIPVVSTDVGGNRELVRDGVTGLLVPPNDPEALARAMSAALDDPERARALAAAGRAFVLTHMSQDVRLARVLEVYRGVIEA